MVRKKLKGHFRELSPEFCNINLSVYRHFIIIKSVTCLGFMAHQPL